MRSHALLRAAGVLLAVGVMAVGGVDAQTPTMPSTLRYGSGLMDVPVSSVLPHLMVTGALSGFRVHLNRRALVDETGLPAGWGPERTDLMGDGSVAIGLFDRAEAGLTFQSFQGSYTGGNVWGGFGRLRLFEPVDQGVGLAVGGRYVTSPDFGDGIQRGPGRLGFPDERLRGSFTAVPGVHSNLSLYAVATAYLRGYDGGPLPENDLTLSLGYGGGMFGAGSGLGFYSEGQGGGWFGGAALHLSTGEESVLVIMAENNGFDVNFGAHFNWAWVRLGAQMLATNHHRPAGGYDSEYMKPKFGLLASIGLCLSEPGFRCTPRRMRRTEPDTIFIPPPPPDTVMVPTGAEAGPPVDGRPASICLSTGRNIPVVLTEAGDTLVGPRNVPISELQPGVEFAGAYAGDAFWYQDDRVVVFEGGDFGKSGDLFPMDCGQILRVGIYEGVPVFAVIDARRPLDVIFIPVQPGLWQRYVRGLRR